jgi:single-stranded-DNA-specific exonuclease
LSPAESHQAADVLWTVRHADPAAVSQLTEALGLDELVARLLVNRGLSDPDEVRAFLKPRLGSMPDPSLMKGMDRAVERILNAIDNEEAICIWGDYDVDGVTSSAQLIAFFQALDVSVRSFVPDRFADGYGLNKERLAVLIDEGIELLITVDCGVSNVDEVAFAQGRGVDVIIVDHHKTPPELPPAYALLDPVQPDCPWPEKGLAACGVTWVLLVALRRAMRARGDFNARREPDLRRWLDLTAIGTVADVVPLRGFNRAIVRYGIDVIRGGTRLGVETLRTVAKVEQQTFKASDIGFKLGPRINAAGRIAHAGTGVELLTSTEAAEARRTAKAIETHNVERQGIQQRVMDEAFAQVEAMSDLSERRSLVLADANWHPGVLGIVASKVAERYHKPTVLMTIDSDLAKGSARSIRGFKLVDALRAVDELLLKYGGHDHAAGLTLEADKVPALQAAFDAHAHQVISPEQLVPRIEVDALLPLGEVSFSLIEELSQLAPHGMGNRSPLFLATHVDILDRRAVGADKRHLKMTLDAGRPLDAIAFGMADSAPPPGVPVDILFVPEVNVFRGKRSLQARIKHMRASA